MTDTPAKLPRDAVRRRLLFVEALLAQGHSRAETIRRTREAFGCTARSAERYLVRLSAQFGEAAAPSEDKREEIDAHLRAVCAAARTEGKYSAAIQALRLRAEINGLLKLRTEVTGLDGGPIRHEHSGAVILLPQRDGDAG